MDSPRVTVIHLVMRQSYIILIVLQDLRFTLPLTAFFRVIVIFKTVSILTNETKSMFCHISVTYYNVLITAHTVHVASLVNGICMVNGIL